MHLWSLLFILSRTLPTPLPLHFPWHHHSPCASCLALPFFLCICLVITMDVVLCHFRLLPLWWSFVLLRIFLSLCVIYYASCLSSSLSLCVTTCVLLVITSLLRHASFQSPLFLQSPISHFLSLHYFPVKSSALPSMHVHSIQLELSLLSSESAHFLSKFSALPSLQAGNFIFSCLFHDSNQRSLAPKPSTQPAVLATLHCGEGVRNNSSIHYWIDEFLPRKKKKKD